MILTEEEDAMKMMKRDEDEELAMKMLHDFEWRFYISRCDSVFLR
jgi:hypothetical protein